MIEIRVRINPEPFLHRGGQMHRNFLGEAGVRDRFALPGCRGPRAQRLGRRRKQPRQLLFKASGRILQQHAILRPPWPRHARLHGGQIELQRLRVLGFRGIRSMEQPLLLVVGLDERDLIFAATGEPQVAQRLRIHREDAAGRAVLGRHVADGCAIGQR